LELYTQWLLELVAQVTQMEVLQMVQLVVTAISLTQAHVKLAEDKYLLPIPMVAQVVLPL
jgi:hypothetical protein